MDFDIWQKLTIVCILLSFLIIAISPVAGGIFFCIVLFVGSIINNRGTM